MSNSIVLEKAIKFALRIVGVYKYLTDNKKEYVMSKQLLLSGSYIAKHVKAALHSQLKPGFSTEMYKSTGKGLRNGIAGSFVERGRFSK